MAMPMPAPRAVRRAGTPHRPSALGYWIGGALMAAAVVGAAIWGAFAFLGGTRHQPGAAGPASGACSRPCRRLPVAARLPSASVWDIRWPAAPPTRPPVAPPWLPAGREIPGSCGDGRVRAVARGEREWAKTWGATLARQLMRARN